MVRLNLEMAGIPFEAGCLFESTAEMLRPYVTQRKPEFSAIVTAEELEIELEYVREAAISENRPWEGFTGAMLEYTAIHRLISEEMLLRDVLLFHGSALAMDGQAYLFTAPSGTGKSTHARYWRRAFGQRVTMINDDKPFLRFARDGGVFACGSPWNGKHRLGQNMAAPLGGVCLLRRGEENRVEPISAGEALPALFRQCHHSREAERELRVLAMLDQLGRNVPLYRLECNLSPEAARTAYAAIHTEGGTK